MLKFNCCICDKKFDIDDLKSFVFFDAWTVFKCKECINVKLSGEEIYIKERTRWLKNKNIREDTLFLIKSYDQIPTVKELLLKKGNNK